MRLRIMLPFVPFKKRAALPTVRVRSTTIAFIAALVILGIVLVPLSGCGTSSQSNIGQTPVAAPTFTANQLVYADALTDLKNPATKAANWDQGSQCVFKLDGYHAIENTSIIGTGQTHGCRESGYQYQLFALTVDLTIISGHTGGVFFRTQMKTLGAYSGYLFEIDNQGTYKISSSGNFSTGVGSDTFKEGTSSALQMGVNAKNTLLIIAGRTSLLFYVNNVYLATWQNATFTIGNIAFLATTSLNGPNADMLYSNLKIYSLPSGATSAFVEVSY